MTSFIIRLKGKIPQIVFFVRITLKILSISFMIVTFLKFIWDGLLVEIIGDKHYIYFSLSSFDKIFGILGDKIIILRPK